MRTPIEVATDLATAHRQGDPGTHIIKFMQAPNSNDLLLLEVTTSVPPVNETLPFGFAADLANGVEYPSVVILLNPADWDLVREEKLPLPQGWNLKQAQDL